MRGGALTVHYLDYGNTEEVGAGALYPWDPALALVPAQATLCRLRDLVEGATLTEEAVAVFEDRGLIDFAKRIRMRGNDLTHRSTRAIKIEAMQDAFATNLPPTILKLD